ncbi:hypothetical protein PCE1_002333 [Barthelona sp. PCE]
MKTQLINEEGLVNDECDDYISEMQGSYSLLSVLGPQSSGKSTLLNALFDCNFDVMDANVGRGKTTHGIFISNTDNPNLNRNLFVMDCEGVDGSVDNVWDRRFSLLSLAISDVLIVNIWNTDIGRYKASGIALLKEVFSAGFKIIGSRPTTLVICVRDTDVEIEKIALEKQLEAEIMNLWQDTVQENSGTSHISFSSFFRLKIVFFSHYIHCRDEFNTEVDSLRNYLLEEIPKIRDIDALPVATLFSYLNQLWTDVLANKDLDLPTERSLVINKLVGDIENEILENVSFNDESVCDLMMKMVNLLRKFDDLTRKYGSQARKRRVLFAEKLFSYATAQLFKCSDSIVDGLISECMETCMALEYPCNRTTILATLNKCCEEINELYRDLLTLPENIGCEAKQSFIEQSEVLAMKGVNDLKHANERLAKHFCTVYEKKTLLEMERVLTNTYSGIPLDTVLSKTADVVSEMQTKKYMEIGEELDCIDDILEDRISDTIRSPVRGIISKLNMSALTFADKYLQKSIQRKVKALHNEFEARWHSYKTTRYKHWNIAACEDLFEMLVNELVEEVSANSRLSVPKALMFNSDFKELVLLSERDIEVVKRDLIEKMRDLKYNEIEHIQLRQNQNRTSYFFLVVIFVWKTLRFRQNKKVLIFSIFAYILFKFLQMNFDIDLQKLPNFRKLIFKAISRRKLGISPSNLKEKVQEMQPLKEQQQNENEDKEVKKETPTEKLN